MNRIPDIARLRMVRQAIYSRGMTLGRSGIEFPIWPTGLAHQAGEFLQCVVAAEAPTRIIETGFAFGLSTLFMLEGMLTAADKNSPQDCKCSHTVVDPYQYSQWDGAGHQAIERAGMSGIVRVVAEDSALYLPELVRNGESFGLGFVDGGHNYDNVFLDLYFMSRLVRPNGVVVVDDMTLPAIHTAIEFFVSNLGVTRCHDFGVSPNKRLAVLRLPPAPVERAWNHFVPFWTPL